MQQEPDVIDFTHALKVLRRRAPLIALCALVVAGAAFAYSKQQTKEYTATASLVFSSNPLSQQIAGLETSSGTSQIVQQASNIELVNLGDMAASTAAALGHGLTEEKVYEDLSVVGQGESSVVAVSATAASPTLAAKIANTYTRQFVLEQQKANQRFFDSALKLVNRQLDELPPEQQFSEAGIVLQNRAQQLKLLNELKYGGVKVAQPAAVPTEPTSPDTRRNTALGLLVGLLIGLGLAFAIERFERERRIRELADLESAYGGLPLLGAVPQSRTLARAGSQGSGGLAPAEIETFNLIQARLRFFNAERGLETIMVASAARNEGKTTIARCLAEAEVRMGSRVLLLEADLRNPTLALQLGLAPGPTLADAIVGAARWEDTIQSVDIGGASQFAGTKTLDVLPAGAATSLNPGELMNSFMMGTILEKVRPQYGLVVLDTPPLTTVSDAFPLLSKVDGVLVVSRLGQGRRDLAEQLRGTLDSSGASQLGVIANGARSGIPEGYGRAVTAPSLQPADIDGAKWPQDPTSPMKV